jgi:hypothetical protein
LIPPKAELSLPKDTKPFSLPGAAFTDNLSPTETAVAVTLIFAIGPALAFLLAHAARSLGRSMRK